MKIRIRTGLAPVVALLLVAANFAQEQKVRIRARDFEAPTQTSEGKRSVIKGSDANHIGNEIYEIISPKVTTYNPDDTVDLLIEAPQCIFDNNKNSPNAQVASSSTNLFVKTGDDKFSIKGVGWRWDPNLSTLSISNNVEALIRKSALSKGTNNLISTNSPSGTNTQVRVTSKTFEHKRDVAVFTGEVLVKDGEDTLKCEILTVHFEEKGGVHRIEADQNVYLKQKETEATGGKAIYRVKEEIMSLQDKPAWRVGTREGTSELLEIHRTNNTFHAEGKVYMKLPYTNTTVQAETGVRRIGGAAARTNVVEIYADVFDYFGAEKEEPVTTAYYRGNVRVKQTDGEIICRFLTLLISPKENKLLTVIAEDQVEIVSSQNKAFGEKAVYDLAEEKITLTGNPRWIMDDKSGSSEVMIFYPKTEELLALDNVKMKLPSGEMGDAALLPARSGEAVKKPVDTNAFMTITARIFSRKDKVSIFRENVHVEDQQGTIDAGLITILTGETNQLQRIVAQDEVVIKQKELTATGQKAVYWIETGLIELTGAPQIEQPNQTVNAELFVIDRNKNTFTMRGRSWKIQMAVTREKTEKRQ